MMMKILYHLHVRDEKLERIIGTRQMKMMIQIMIRMNTEQRVIVKGRSEKYHLVRIPCVSYHCMYCNLLSESYTPVMGTNR
jgi:hypothetical protein